MRSYTDRGFSEIPFTKYLDEQSDYRGKTPNKTDSGIRLITARNIKMGFINYECSKEFIAESDYDEVMSRGLPKCGDLLFTTEAPLGNVAIVDDKNIALAQRVIRFRTNSEKLNNVYALFVMTSDYFQDQIKILSQGLTVQGIKSSKLNQLKMFLPSIEEQHQIVSCLSNETLRIDNLIAEKQNFIKLLQEKRQALISHVMTKGLNPNVPMKDSGVEWIGEIPEHWDVKRFRHVFSLGKGLTITKDNLKDSGISCVNYGEIHSKYNFELDLNKHHLKYVEEEYLTSSPSSLINKGDFVFADTSEDFDGCGNFTHLVSEDPIFAGYHTVIARLTNECDSRYVSYLLDSKEYRDQIRRSVKGVKVFSITQKILKDTVLFFPGQEKQREAVKYLDHKIELMKELEKETKNSIELLKEHRIALISAAVTGKIDVREVA